MSDVTFGPVKSLDVYRDRLKLEHTALIKKMRAEIYSKLIADGVDENEAEFLADVELIRQMEAKNILYPKEVEPDYGTCKVVYMQDGQPIECGGKLKLVEIYKPFDEFTPIGGNYQAPVIDSFIECLKCKVRKST